MLFPAQLHMDSWSEPDYSKEDAHHETPTELHGSLAVTQLHPADRYSPLRYDDAANVPDRQFLKSKYNSRVDFVAPTSGQVEFPVHFMSNSTAFFRCVHAPEASAFLI